MLGLSGRDAATVSLPRKIPIADRLSVPLLGLQRVSSPNGGGGRPAGLASKAKARAASAAQLDHRRPEPHIRASRGVQLKKENARPAPRSSSTIITAASRASECAARSGGAPEAGRLRNRHYVQAGAPHDAPELRAAQGTQHQAPAPTRTTTPAAARPEPSVSSAVVQFIYCCL